MTEKTQEHLDAEAKAAAEKAEKDAADKAAKQKAKDEAKAKKEAEAAAKKEAKAKEKAEKEAKKAKEKAEKEAKKAEEKAAKEKAKADAEAAKAAAKMPEQNGVRRPKPETLCGKAWAIFDSVSAKNGSPASIKESLEVARTQNLNEGNVKAEYARWRKFYAISGRVAAPDAAKPVAPETTGEHAAAEYPSVGVLPSGNPLPPLMGEQTLRGNK